MALTFYGIATITVGSGGTSSLLFDNIPQTYTDLKLLINPRGTTSAKYVAIGVSYNSTSSTTNWTKNQVEGGDATVTGSGSGNSNIGYPPAATQTSSTFGSIELYIPNYTSSSNKLQASLSVGEGDEANNVYTDIITSVWANSSAITSITITPSTGNFAQYTTAYLYGIKNS